MGVIKIAKQGFDVIKNNKKRYPDKKTDTPIRMYSPMILIFLNGAKKQVARYQETVKLEEKTKTPRVVIEYLHEAFTLFEDLATLGKYIKKCKDETKKKSIDYGLMCVII